MKEHLGTVYTLAFSSRYNGLLLASGSADTTIKLWNWDTEQTYSLEGHNNEVLSVAFFDNE